MTGEAVPLIPRAPAGRAPAADTAPACPTHHEPMLLRHSRAGTAFYGCAHFAAGCRETAPVGIGVDCPRCSAPVVERRAKKTGRVFWPCSSKACTFVAWERPHKCGACGAGCFGVEPDRPRPGPDAVRDPAGHAPDDPEVPF